MNTGELMMGDLKIGDIVVEPTLGICRVEGIRSLAVDGRTEDYFVLQARPSTGAVPQPSHVLAAQKATSVMVSRSQLGKRGIRRPMSPEEVKKMLALFRDPVVAVRKDAREDYLEYQEILKSGDPGRVCKLLRKLHILDQTDELKGKEKEVMELARKFLVDEFSHATGSSKAKAAADIQEGLKTMIKKKQKKERDAQRKERRAARDASK